MFEFNYHEPRIHGADKRSLSGNRPLAKFLSWRPSPTLTHRGRSGLELESMAISKKPLFSATGSCYSSRIRSSLACISAV